MTTTTTTDLPAWTEMSDVDKGCALLHLWKREWEGASYAVSDYPAKYMDDPRLLALSPREACRHAVKVCGSHTEAEQRLGRDEHQRLYDLALAEPDRRCLWAARHGADNHRPTPTATREYAVELLTVHWPANEACYAAMDPRPSWWTPADQSTWALLHRDEPGGEWDEVPLAEDTQVGAR